MLKPEKCGQTILSNENHHKVYANFYLKVLQSNESVLGGVHLDIF